MRTLILLLLTLTAAPAALADSTPQWLEMRTPHFIVYTNSNEKEASHIGGQFERMRIIFRTFLPNSNADAGAAPIVVLALKDRKDFQTLVPAAYLTKGSLDLAGYFLTGPDKNYILLRLDTHGEHPFSTVYHEYTHYMLRKVHGVPLWLNEGLAEFYQNTEIRDKVTLVGEPSSDDILFLRENKLLPLPTLLAVDQSSPYYHDEQKGSVFYAQSWALVHLLRFGDQDHGTNRINDYVKLVSQGQDPVSAGAQAFGDLGQLQAALQTYTRENSFKTFSLHIAFPVDESTFQARPVPASEVDAVRADILMDNGRTAEGQALLETVLRDNPKSPLAHETMGSIKFHEGDLMAARKWYGEAVQLGSQSYLAHYYFAIFSMQSGDDADHDAIEASLRESIKLNPGFAPSYDALAGFYGRHNEKLDEAHMLNLQAVSLDPTNLNFRLNSASVLMQKKDFTAALSVLHAAAKLANTPGATEMIDTRIRQVEQTQAFMQHPPEDVYTAPTSGVDTANSDAEPDTPKYPTGPPSGPHHTVKGTLHSVKCSYPTVLTLSLDTGGKSLSLYTNNFYKIAFSFAYPPPTGDLDPCKTIEGMKARVEYGEVADKTIAGQIISIELTK